MNIIGVILGLMILTVVIVVFNCSLKKIKGLAVLHGSNRWA